MYTKHFMFVVGVIMFGLSVSKCDTTQCAETIYASDVSRWLDSYGGKIDYRDGVWYADGVAIGVSPTEDSDVCPV